MDRPSFTATALTGLVLWLGMETVCLADVVKLRNGGEIRGTVFSPAAPIRTAPADEPLVVQTMTGAMVTVPGGDVEFFLRRSRVFEEHEWLVRRTPDTIDGLWELQTWCRDNGLRTLRDEHLEQIVERDANHVEAHRLLGHVQYEGRWMSRDAMMAAKGLVKYKGRYVFQQELEVLERSAADRTAETAWHKKLYQWREWVAHGSPEQMQAARANFAQVRDPHAVAPMSKLLHDHPLEEIRLSYVTALGQIGGDHAVKSLVVQSLQDPSAAVRGEALRGLKPEDRPLAAPIFVRGLHDEVNAVVLRAAVGLARVGGIDEIPDLIDALNTTHTYQVPVRESQPIPGLVQAPLTQPANPPQALNVPLTASGGLGAFGVEVPLQVSPPPARPLENVRIRQVTVVREHQNGEVLSALRTLTHQDFGYDERTWKLWWASSKGPLSKKPTT